MTKQRKPEEANAFLLLKQLEQVRPDGTKLTIESAEVNSEEDRRHLQALLGTAAAPASEQKADTGKTLSDLVAAFLAEGDRAGKWSVKFREELESCYALLTEVVGEKKLLAQMGREDIARFKELLLKLPSNRSKDARYRGKSVLELAGMAIPKSDLLANNTFNKVMVRCSSLFKWGVRHGYVTANYAEGMTIARSKRADEERGAMPDAEVLRLKDAVLQGLHSTARAKWLPLIGMYGGLRINEVAQLELSDFSEVDGIPVMSINDKGEGKRLKNDNSRRTVPVHPELVRLGLLEHVEEQRKRGAKRLFPDFPQGRYGCGQAASKWFGHLRERLGLQHNFHSLRHTFATKLREADVSKEDIADLLGHSRGEGETAGRYMKAASARRLREALSKLSYAKKPKA